ncbi:hypothetical protein Taro_052286 [Colocasia esculenta]|uniref:NAD(P)H-quinone oxidoreductase subunit M, chloroplastic n=1 Tax=Colocasia esculenta TaxID=4460 RepID=A0A843XI72_COLES|nr:hypothetical protein [Colocasia esculenta]
MASIASFLAPNTSSRAWAAGRRNRARKPCTVVMSQAAQQQQLEKEQTSIPGQQQQQPAVAAPSGAQQLPPQPMAKSKNMSREYGGQWLSSCTRHVRIYAAYIDPVTHAFDQSQMDKLTLILDPTNEFVWTNESCQKVYSQFQELVDHYEASLQRLSDDAYSPCHMRD